MAIRVGINGFGSIGRRFFRQSLDRPEIEVVAVNDIGDIRTAAHLLQYDSNYGRFPGEVAVDEGAIVAAGRRVRFFQERDPGAVPWSEAGVELVVESTGLFESKDKAIAHIERGGAKKVVISAPGQGVDLTVVMGVNEAAYDPRRHHVVSNASCTTNCLAPVVKVLDDAFGVEHGLMTTVHALTNDQRVLDLPHRDIRRARAAGQNIIPTTTGAARAVGEVLPHLKGRLNGIAMRVPVPVVSVVDVTVVTRAPVDVASVNDAFRRAEAGPLRGILGTDDRELVSGDYKGDTRSAVVDLPLTMVSGDRVAKVVAWYDNEWGYSARLVDLCAYVAARGL
ncbi:MAG: type I glyceraldehyde-3-phosphate dehydrogenase [Clostridia bacterium]|nr:type I glyceraldehyde-3-phosphate dehydrogenase [Clostridia bacterium]